MPTEITVQNFIEGVEQGYITECFTVAVAGEQRVYGKTPEGQADNPRGFILVYAVVT